MSHAVGCEREASLEWLSCSITSFGFGRTNAHILLQRNEKETVNGGAPVDLIRRLVVASGCTEEAVSVILEDVSCTVCCRYHYLKGNEEI